MKHVNFGLVACILLCGWAHLARAEDPALKDARAKWDAMRAEIKDLTIEQEMTMPQAGAQAIAMTLRSKGPKSRIETRIQGMTMTMILDGTDAWMVTPMGAQKVPQQQGAQTFNAMSGRAWPEDARLAGQEKVSGKDCNIIEFKGANDQPVRLWVGRDVPTIVKSEMRQGTDTVVALFSDFRKVHKDYEMGYTCEMTAGAKSMGTMTVKSVKVNSGLADDLFDPQAAAKSAPAPAR